MSLDFVAGCVGGIAGVIVGHPLDTVKVHLQTQDHNAPKYRGTIHCFRSLMAKDCLKGLYRGVSSPIVGVAGINAVVFGVYGNTQRRLSDPESLRSHALAGAAAGLFQSFICSPMELAKSRLQVSDKVGNNPLECLKKIYGSEGIKGLSRGLGLTIAREIPGYSAYFFTYELLTRTEDEGPISTGRMLFAGGFAGVVSWTVTYPVDAIKSRIQVDGITSTKYAGAYDCLKKTVKSSGLTSLFRGLTPTLVRAFPVNAVTFAVVTWTVRILQGDALGKFGGNEFGWSEFLGRLSVSEKSLVCGREEFI
ncbi:unnamed protein product [Phaedon cochleariae]|uniref:Mitochondrial basic amino acids transporter n=1 Tax=Phaedon cochleariae TaxID=80249 RepID=A0A9P0DGI4_PHACE|nr:unnamed protein product [Phaedon cochleariae]